MNIEVDFTTNRTWHSSYVRTRHKNLRCFPCCSPYHKESSFCGVSVIVDIYGLDDPRNWTIIGALRRLQDDPYKHVGQKVPSIIPETHKSNQLIIGNETKIFVNERKETVITYEFVPPRRWKYNCRLAKHTSSQKHTFSVYVCRNETMDCVALINSPTFQIKSAWRQTSETVSRPRSSVNTVPNNGLKEETMQQFGVTSLSTQNKPLRTHQSHSKGNKLMVQPAVNVLWPTQLRLPSDALLLQQQNAMYNIIPTAIPPNNIRNYTQAFGSATSIYSMQTSNALNPLITGNQQQRIHTFPDTIEPPLKRQVIQKSNAVNEVDSSGQICDLSAASQQLATIPSYSTQFQFQAFTHSPTSNCEQLKPSLITTTSVPMVENTQVNYQPETL